MLPNFLIVGAAKSGTSSLYRNLQQHPDVFMPEFKEPKFITSQFLDINFRGPGDVGEIKDFVEDFEEYKRLFEPGRDKPAIGEASADNLYYHDRAIPRIKELLGTPRIIIMLRDPAARAYSSYMHLTRDAREHLSFEDAFAAEEQRISENYFFLWHYTRAGFYHDAVVAYLEAFPRVHVTLFDDFREDPAAAVADVLGFLGLDPLPSLDASRVHNPSGRPRLRLVNRFLQRPNPVKSVLKAVLPRPLLKAARQRILEINSARRPMRPETRRRLKGIYRDDVRRLGRLLDRDLNHWD